MPLAGDIIDASDVPGNSWTDYTPVITGATSGSLTVGNGTMVGRYYRVGALCVAQMDFTFGSTSSAAGISGAMVVSLPFAARATSPSTLGIGFIADNSPLTRKTTVNVQNTVNNFLMVTSDAGTILGATAPWTWATSDFIRTQVSYETA